MSFISEKCRLYIINIMNCQNSNDKQRIGNSAFRRIGGSKYRTFEPCATNISGPVQDKLVIFCAVVRSS